MFDITKMEIVDFKSFMGEHEFDFPETPGLYLIEGENLTETRLGANGVGKTSLLDASHWCMYGTTPGGLKAGEVINWWGATSCMVRTYLKLPNAQPIITRTQSPNSLTIYDPEFDDEPKPATQEQINALVRMSSDAFLNSIMIPHGEDMFFDLKPTAKLKLFSDIMDLEYWNTRSELAKKETSLLEGVIDEITQNLSRMKGSRKSLKDQIVKLEEEARAFDHDKKRSISKLKEDIVRAKKTGRKDDDKLVGLEREIDAIEGAVTSIRLDKTKVTEATQAMQARRTDASTEARVFENDIKHLKDELEPLTRLKGNCPLCKQSIDKAHLDRHRKRISNKIEGKKKDQFGEMVLVNNLDTKIGKERRVLAQLSSEAEDYHIQSKAIQKQITSIESAVQVAREKVNQLEIRLDGERSRSNPYKNTIENNKNEIVSINEEINEDQSELTECESERELTSFWIQGFKKVRLYLIEETLQQLEIEVNNNLVQLGLVDWRIEFDIERENKTGGITTGFSVMIWPPNKSEAVRWEAWSGGEKQRLRVAGTLGFAHLILDRSGLTSGIEFFDEFSKHLSPEGIDDILETLHQRAISERKKIWIVDHQSVTFGGFAGILNIVKDENGSHLNYERTTDGE